MRLKFLLSMTIVAVLSACGGGGGSDENTSDEGSSSLVNNNVSNKPPVVDAGPDQTVYLNSLVEIRGSATDDGEIVGYKWEKGNSVLESKAVFTYTATAVGKETLTLTVTDDDGLSSSDSLEIETVQRGTVAPSELLP